MIATETIRNRSTSVVFDVRGAWLAIVGAGLLLALVVTYFLISRPIGPPVPRPTPVVVDSGFHEALAQDGSIYMINAPYGAMSDGQRDEANNFAHEFPSGLLAGNG